MAEMGLQLKACFPSTIPCYLKGRTGGENTISEAVVTTSATGADGQNSDDSFGNGKKDINGRSIKGQSMERSKENICLARV